MAEISPNIEESWKKVLSKEFRSEYFFSLKAFLVEEKRRFTVYPPGPLIFNAFNRTPFERVKAVIIGQDPYHGKGQAHGLCFSVPRGIAVPPSLLNIFREMHNDTGLPIPSHGNLEKWADSGILLLNATLTVRAANAGSHQGKGWELFTDAVIRKISHEKENVVFFLWGRFAQAKEHLIDRHKHLVLKAAHPSPLSAFNGFFGCKHFSKTNKFLADKGLEEVDWML